MSRKLPRSHSADSLYYPYQPSREYHDMVNVDYGYHSPAFNQSGYHDQGYGMQSGNQSYELLQARQARGTRNPRQADYHRHVTWDTPDHLGRHQASNSQIRQDRWDEQYARGSQSYDFQNTPCPIHGYRYQTPAANVRRGVSYEYGIPNPQTSTSSLYDMNATVSRLRAGYRSGGYDCNWRAGWERLLRPDRRLSSHSRFSPNHNSPYTSWNDLNSTLKNNSSSSYIPLVPEQTVQLMGHRRPKWRRSLAGLSKWSMW